MRSTCRTLLAVSGLLAATGLLTAADDKPAPLRYLRPGEGQLVLESEITATRTPEGAAYVSRTDRGSEKMTLTLHFNKDGQVTTAEAEQETAKGKQSAQLKIDGRKGQLQRAGGITDVLDVAGNPIVTTAPDWSDIFLLVRRYDGKKAGKQVFPGLWIHPSKPPLQLTFTIERTGKDTITVDSRKVALDRFRIHLRSGDYLAWADADGRVCKLFPASKPTAYVVLDGFDGATRDLK
jgi:hypothetical protein